MNTSYLGAMVIVILVILLILYYYRRQQTVASPVTVSAPVATGTATTTTVVAGTGDMPGRVITTASDGNHQTVQYGDMTPEEAEPLYENFSPYASILSKDMFRSDAAFDASKDDVF
jgi:hypothetical protein